MLIVFAGSVGRFPVGGHAWVNLQYLLGLRELGHEVYYLEDCGDGCWVHVWETGETTEDPVYAADYVRACLEPFGFGTHWILRAGVRSLGLSLKSFQEICAQADLLLIRAVPIPRWRPEYDWPRRRAFIDVDPGFTQVSLMNREPVLTGTLARCESLFTIAQRLGAADCRIPEAGRPWVATVPPVWLPAWPIVPNDGTADRFATIMQWRSYQETHAYASLLYDGIAYGQKDEAFERYVDLPQRTPQKLVLGLTGAPPESLAKHGWEVLRGWEVTRTPDLYRQFIQRSRAEFSLAKRGYVRSRGGWFSDRSVCFLATGRPVLTEDTGLADWLPLGQGVLSFQTPAEALKGIEAINGDYEHHCRAARRLAERYFSTKRVLPALLENAMCT